MFDIFGSVKGFLKIETVCIDNNIFRLHYKVTVIVLIIFCLMVTSHQYIGDPIECTRPAETVSQNMIDAFCWVHSTYSVHSTPKTQHLNKHSIYPGVRAVHDDDKIHFHKYYQWVCFMLFFQAMLFYIPRYLWKTWEGGRIRMLALDLKSPIIDEKCKNDRMKLLVDYFVANLRMHEYYVYKFILCEIFNLINVIGQIYLMDAFLQGAFSNYGRDVLANLYKDPEMRDDPMSKVFPTIAKCMYKKFGPSGTPEVMDSQCILSLNIVNEKIYVFLWFWFMILSALSVFSLAYRVAVIAFPKLRFYLLRSRARLAPSGCVSSITDKCILGDWFVLYQLAKNIDPAIFKDIVIELADNFDGKTGKIAIV